MHKKLPSMVQKMKQGTPKIKPRLNPKAVHKARKGLAR